MHENDQRRFNTLSVQVITAADGSKQLIKKVSLGTIGVDARIAWFGQNPDGEWIEIEQPATETRPGE